MKSNAAPQTITAGQVPLYCYLLLGVSEEEGAVEAIKAHNISHHCDALALLWKLRRVACDGQTDGRTSKTRAASRKTNQGLLCKL